jgi:L-iditol 2-dehydrogenase
MAKQFPADRLVNTTTEDLVEIVKAETGGVGADCAIIAAPSAEPQEQALDLVHKKGSVCLFASLPVGRNILAMDSRKIHYNELNVVGASDSTAGHVQQAVALLSKESFPADLLASHILGIEEFERAISIMTNREGMRVVLKT